MNNYLIIFIDDVLQVRQDCTIKSDNRTFRARRRVARRDRELSVRTKSLSCVKIHIIGC